MRVLLILFTCLLLSKAHSQNCFYPGQDSNWVSRLTGNGQSGRLIMAAVAGKDGVYCLSQDRQSSRYGGLTTNASVNLWNGKTWIPVGPLFPLSGSTMNLIGMELVGDSALYICGRFTTATTPASSGLIRLNLKTGQYEPLSYGVTSSNGFIQRVKAWGDTLYVMGQFTQVSDAVKSYQANNVARYIVSTNRWDTLGGGLGSYIPNIADNISFESYCQIEITPWGEVFFGGRFSSAGGLPATNIASWQSGRGWKNAYGGVKAYNGSTPISSSVYSINYNPRDTFLYVTGFIGWTANAPVGRSGMKGFGRFRDTLWTQQAEQNWTADSIWNFQFSGYQHNTTYASYLDTSTQNLWLGGSSQILTNHLPLYQIGQKLFSVPGKGVSSALRVRGICQWQGKVFAVGSITECDSGLRTDNMAFYENGKWHPVGGGFSTLSTSKSVDALAVDAQGRLIIGGEFEYAGGNFCRSLALMDSNWNIQPLNTGLLSNTVSGGRRQVRSILVHGDSILLGGYMAGGGSVFSYGIIGYHQSSNSWYKLGSNGLSTYSYLNTLCRWDGKIVAGGYFSSIDNLTTNNLAYWNGMAWIALGNPNGEIKKVINLGDTALLVFGNFSTIGNQNINRLALYYQGSWSSIGQSGIPSADFVSVNPLTGEIWTNTNNSITQYSGKGNSGSFNAQGYAVLKDSVWQDFGTLSGGLGANAGYIFHDSNGVAYLLGNFTGVAGNSAVNALRFATGNTWAGLSYGNRTQQFLTNPETRSALSWRGHLVTGGIFEYSGTEQTSFLLSAYKIDPILTGNITVDLGPDTITYYGYTISALLTGNYDSLRWNHGNQNQLHLNVDTSGQYILLAGINGCWFSDTVQVEIKGENIYQGGTGDGHSLLWSYAGGTMPGGAGDGTHTYLYTQNGKMPGGTGDGTHTYRYTQKGKMPGGAGDGTHTYRYTQKGKMPGGSGDGTHTYRYTQKGKMPGGTGDGTHTYRYTQNGKMPGGAGDGHTVFNYLARPDAQIQTLIHPEKLSDTDSSLLATTVINAGDYPVYGYDIYWFINGSLHEKQSWPQDSLLPGDSVRHNAVLKFVAARAQAPYTICGVVRNIAREQDTLNNELCALLQSSVSIDNEPADIGRALIKGYPNPTRDVFMLEFSEKDETGKSYQLFSPEGRILEEKNLPGDTLLHELNLASNPPGIYQLRVRSGRQILYLQVVVF